MANVDHVFEIELKKPFLGLLAVVGGNHGDENYTVLGLWVHFREEIIPENDPRILLLLSNWVFQGRLPRPGQERKSALSVGGVQQHADRGTLSPLVREVCPVAAKTAGIGQNMNKQAGHFSLKSVYSRI